MKKLCFAVAVAAFAFGFQALGCTSGIPGMSTLAPYIQEAILQGLREDAAQAAAAQARARLIRLNTEYEQEQEQVVPPAPPPPLFVQADPLTPPELISDFEVAIPAQAQPIEMDEVVVIS
ncbi:MAG: hypothetical protein R3F62_30715 [Planctomycetota bacterium]